MKRIAIWAFVALSSLGPMLPAQESEKNSVQQLTVQDYDDQISDLKDDIKHYSGLAAMYGEQAELAQFRDFSGYRDQTELQNRCLAIVQELKAHLNLLEQQKEALMQKPAVFGATATSK